MDMENTIKRVAHRVDVLPEISRPQYAAIVQSILVDNDGTVSKFLDGPDDTLTTTILIEGQLLHVYLDEWGARLQWEGAEQSVLDKIVERLQVAIGGILSASAAAAQSFRWDFKNTLSDSKIASTLASSLPEFDWRGDATSKTVRGLLRDPGAHPDMPPQVLLRYRPRTDSRSLEMSYSSMMPANIGHHLAMRSKIRSALAVAAAFDGEYIPWEDMGIRE